MRIIRRLRGLLRPPSTKRSALMVGFGLGGLAVLSGFLAAIFYPAQVLACLAIGALVVLVVLTVNWITLLPRHFRLPVLEVYHAPERVSRRSHDLSANVTGRFHPAGRGRYRVNGGPWLDLPTGDPRARPPNFTIELLDSDLTPGPNTVEIEASAPLRRAASARRTLNYDPAPVRLPVTIDWSDGTILEPQDGMWETIDTPLGRRARPARGHEEYDRILNLTGTFPGGRRVETDIRFHKAVQRQYGLGSLLLWGGHCDTHSGMRPRRGWVYGICWYLHDYGAGVEFQSCWGDGVRHTCQHYSHLPKRPTGGEHFRFISECWPEYVDGREARFHVRCKWWTCGDPEPDAWIELPESSALRLPLGREWSVALMAHNCAVDFGPVHISALDSPPEARSRSAARSAATPSPTTNGVRAQEAASPSGPGRP